MKQMFADGDIGLIGLLFFFSVFVGIALWVYHPKRKSKVESYKNIPLNEDEHDRT